jgi:hypothetical protein
MKRSVIFFFFLGISLVAGGIRADSGHENPPNPALAPRGDFNQSLPFQRALHSEPTGAAFQRARIDYLLERISKSPYNFLRNGDRFPGKRAEAHYRWKYALNLEQVKTAEQFIDEVMTRSKISGQTYYVELPDKSRRPLREFMTYELKTLDEELEKRREVALE